jgi:hypothetical protein
MSLFGKGYRLDPPLSSDTLDVGLTRRILPIRDLGCGVFSKFFPRAADYMGVLLRCVSAD